MLYPNQFLGNSQWWLAPSPEQRVEPLRPQVDIELGGEEVEALLRSGEYRVATGLRSGRHFRKEHGNGCFHLRLDGQRAFLHRDEWDPRRFPVRHFFETPELWGTASALGVIALVFAGAARSK